MRRLFALDLRSLAIFRISLGSIAAYDFLSRLGMVGLHYSQEGTLPLSEVASRPEYSSILGFFCFSDDPTVQKWILIVAAGLGLLLALGFRTRLASVLTWFAVASLNNRNPELVYGADRYLAALLFWGIFLPWGHVFSLDSWGSKSGKQSLSAGSNFTIYSDWPAIALVTQIGIVYLATALWKLKSPVWIDGSALYFGLASKISARWSDIAGYFLGQRVLTWSVPFFEILGFLLVLSPWRTSFCRTIAVVGFVSLHVVIFALLDVGYFSAVSIAAWGAMIPASWWEKLGSDSRRENHELDIECLENSESEFNSRIWSPLLEFLGKSVAIGLLIWNFAPILNLPRPQIWHELGGALSEIGLNQSWTMFVLNTQEHESSWYIAAATVEGGGQVDLLRKSQTLSLEYTPMSSPWGSNVYLANYLQGVFAAPASRGGAFLRFLCKPGMVSIGGNPTGSSLSITRVDLMRVREMILPQGGYGSPVVETLLSQDCGTQNGVAYR